MVFSPKAEEKGKDASFKKISALLEEKGAKISQKEHTGTKNLEYLIAGENKADFWELKVEADKPVKLNDFNVLLNREPNIIRYLVLKV